jgi:hypothetical protein
MKTILALLSAAILWLFSGQAVAQSCPYSSVQIRVQPNTSTPWSTSASVPAGGQVHVGVFRNGSGVPVSPGTVTVVAVQGNQSPSVPLSNGWESWWSRDYAATWRFDVYCGGGGVRESAFATFTSTGTIDVLSYVKPGDANGVRFSIVTNLGNPWRTFSKNNGNLGERLPGFYITKGNVHVVNNATKAWNFEQMIYDSTWIYLVRDTSWTAKCLDVNPQIEAGMLLLTYENGQWLRGGRHFPRFIRNGGTAFTGNKLIQGTRKKKSPTHNVQQEGAWCSAEFSGVTSSTMRAELVSSYVVGNRTFFDVLKLSTAGGSGEGDAWWFAKGYGLIRFSGPNGFNEQHSHITNPYEVDVRIPCEPQAPCM